MSKVLLAINPASGKGKTRSLIPEIKKLCAEFDSLTIFESEYKGHIIEYLISNSAKYGLIISAGGDGTLNEVINGINLDSPPDIAVYAVGSGNDFGTQVKQIVDLKSFLTHYFDNQYEYVYSDLGKCSIQTEDSQNINRNFANVAGIGFDALVASENRKVKLVKGHLSYIVAVFKSFKKMEYINSDIIFDGLNMKTDTYTLITIGNTDRSGGGFFLNPGAKYNDGLFNLTTLCKLSWYKILMRLPLALINKTERIEEAEFKLAKEISIDISPAYYLHFDGEIITEKMKSIKIENIEKCIRVLF